MEGLRKPASLVLVVAVIAGVCGCGGSSGNDPASVVKAYLQALANGDGQTACAQFTGEAQRALAARAAVLGASTCPEAISKASQRLGSDQKSKLQNATIASVSTSGDTATVTIKGATRPAHLTQVGGRWYISRIGI